MDAAPSAEIGGFGARPGSGRGVVLSGIATVVVAVLAGACAGTPCDEDFHVAPAPVCEGDSRAHRTVAVFWAAFDRHYALFEERSPGDWAALGAEACAAVSAETDDAALYDVLLGLARRFDDGHVQLEADDLDRSDDGWVSLYPRQAELPRLTPLVESRYAAAALRRGALDAIAWGRIDDLGYIAWSRFDDLSSRGDEGPDVQAARAAMREAMAELSSSRGLIVDVRDNEGGWDAVALEVAPCRSARWTSM